MRTRVAPADVGVRLTPYVPRVVLRYLDDQIEADTVEGSVVFVDVSGFTKLSERLQRTGREGAEHLADAIGACFSSMLALAYGNGGSLLKFGGDALLLLFEGRGHVERACQSAIAMRRELRTVGRIEAGPARVNLRMSVGVHSDVFHLFLVGGSHRELIVTGPAATAVVEAEGAAEAGEIVVTDSTAERLPQRCLGERRGPGRLLLRMPPGVHLPPTEVAAADEASVAGCLSTEVRAHVESGVVAPEHRSVTVAFLHFDGTDDLIASGGASLAAGALHDLVDAVQAAAEEHGVCFLGSDVDADGGKFILTSGAPRALDEPEQRMLLALRRIVETPLPLPVRIGVHRGPVFAGDIGPQYRRTYTVMGDAVNLAARLMAKAPPGAIYATAGVLEHSPTRFDSTPLEPFTVKGKTHPVEAWSVGPALGRRTAVTDEVPLAGRRSELARIDEALAAAREGRGRLVELVGEPGIGKSRLIEETRRRAVGALRLDAVCEAYSSSTPYAAWRQLMRQLIDVAPDEVDAIVLRRLHAVVESRHPDLLPWLPLLAMAHGIDAPPTPEVEALAPEFRQARLHEVVLRYLRGRLDGEALVTIEDAQNMDAATRDLLAALVATGELGRWLVVVARREAARGYAADTNSPLVVQLDLGPLAPDETLALAEALTDSAPLPPHVLPVVCERAAGNPQFLRDLLRAATAGDTELPASLESAAMARIDRLPPADRMLLRRAAVLGASFDLDSLADVVDEATPLPGPETFERLGDLLEVHADGMVRFRRGLVREAAYAGLPFATRRRLHRLVGERLEQESVGGDDAAADVLSRHFLLAGDLERGRRYAVAAAEHARRRFAFADAADSYRRALDAARRLHAPDAAVADLWEALGQALVHTGQPEAAIAAFAAARRLVRDDPVRSAQLRHRQACAAMDSGGVGAAVRYAQRGLRALDGVPDARADRCRALLVAIMAKLRQRQGRSAEAVRLCRQAIADGTRAGEDEAVACASYVLDWALVESGEVPGGHSQRAIELYHRLGDIHAEAGVLNNLGNFAYRAGRWADAIDIWRRAADASLRAGDTADAAFGDGNVAELRSDQGRLAEAEELFARALRAFRATNQSWAIAYTLALMGRLAVRARRLEDAESLLADALARCRALNAERDAAFVELIMAEAAVAAGVPERALALTDGLLARPSAEGRLMPNLHRVRGAALAQAGRSDAARLALVAALQSARAHAEDYEVANALDALLELGELTGTEPEDAGAMRRERDAILARLDVARLPSLPLAA